VAQILGDDHPPLTRSAGEAAADVIRRAILDGTLFPGQRLTEEGLARDLKTSAEFRALPSARASELRELSNRLGDLVQGIAGHYRDDSLYSVYEATKVRIAAESGVQAQAQSLYQNCNERLAAQMGKYVAENEALINGYMKREAARRAAR